MRPTPRRSTLTWLMIVGVVLTFGGLPGAATASAATKASVPAGTGYDISNFQCGNTLPTSPAFVVMEVEGAPFNRTTSSSCLQSQNAYASTTTVAPQFYVYAADTSTRGGSHTVTAACGSSPTTTCVHDYSAAAAEDAVASVDAAGLPVTPSTWWVDVECATSSCPDWHVTDGRSDLNQASLLGYIDGLRSRPDRVGAVGFYSTNYQWNRITGQTSGSPAFGVEGLPVWYAAATANVADGATQYCGTVGFTGGPVAIVQGAPVITATDGSQTDPDLLCQQQILPPAITGVTQNALAGSLITASGNGPASTLLTISVADSFRPSTPLAQVTSDASGHWTETFHLGSNGAVTVSDPAGEAQTTPIVVIAKVAVSKTKAVGLDRVGHCIDRVYGTTYPYVAGSRVYLRGARDKIVGLGKVSQHGKSGTWDASMIVTCGKTGTTTKATVSGRLPGKAARYAGDGRTAAVKLPVNRSIATRH